MSEDGPKGWSWDPEQQRPGSFGTVGPRGCCHRSPPPARPLGSRHMVAFFPSVRPPVGRLAGPDSSLMEP